MNKKNLCLMALLLTAVMSCLGAFLLKSFGDHNLPVGLGIDDPAITAAQFCDALNSGDTQAIESMLKGNPKVVPEFGPEQQIDRELYDNLLDSISCKLDKNGVVEGMNASFDVSVSYFAFSLAVEDIRGCAQQIYDSMMAGTSDTELTYDENGNLLESTAMSIYEEAVRQILVNRESYTISRSVSLELVYENKHWEVILTDDLADIPLGKAAN